MKITNVTIILNSVIIVTSLYILALNLVNRFTLVFNYTLFVKRMSYINDLIFVLRGLRMVVEAGVKAQQEVSQIIWSNSSLKVTLQALPTNPPIPSTPTPELTKDIVQRALVVAHGFRQYAVMHIPNFNSELGNMSKLEMDQQTKDEIDELNREFNKTFESLKVSQNNPSPPSKPDIVLPLENLELTDEIEKLQNSEKLENTKGTLKTINKEILGENVKSQEVVPNTAAAFASGITAKPSAKKKIKIALSKNSKARVVPSSRIGRMFSFGSLAAGLGIGTVAQYARNTLQAASGREEPSHSFLSPANAERIVDTLCKVRGAALKLGQLLSIQDEEVISPELQRIFERVRQSADFMPTWQVEKVMCAQLGPDWRSRVHSFEEKPFAAASIGQVHLASLHNGRDVAVKVQYPGVAKGINSDIDNLVGVMKVWNMFPKGMFVDNIVEVAKKELAWEVNYTREAECTHRFKQLLAPYPEYLVPEVIDELCAQEVITTEFVDGVPLDKLFDAPYEVREDVASKIMRLCLREMFVFKCMQTDPNWANFFYKPSTKQVILLDFGATREYSQEFMDQYIEIIKAASMGDRAEVLRMSLQLKLLTGYESKIMEEAHIDTVMIMGEVFTLDEEFDFGTQKTTRRIQALVPTILTHRLCPPPEEIYSLHRKLSGVFLLCSKMKIKMNCRDMFNDIYEKYKTDRA